MQLDGHKINKSHKILQTFSGQTKNQLCVKRLTSDHCWTKEATPPKTSKNQDGYRNDQGHVYWLEAAVAFHLQRLCRTV